MDARRGPGARAGARRRARHAGGGVRVVAILLASVMPGTAAKMLRAVGAGDGAAGSTRRRAAVRPGARIEAVGALFPRIDEPIA